MAQSVMERKGPNGKLRVAVYCRVSGDGDGSLNTLEVQRDHYTQEIQAHPEWKLAGIFADESLTGADRKKRTEFNRMIAACKRGHVDLILTRSVSRFARNLGECIKTVQSLKAKGVHVVFERENINTASDAQAFQAAVYDHFALSESECVALNLICPASGSRMK
nr:recombinase family protein [uncultured Oscillibacter sp.]